MAVKLSKAGRVEIEGLDELVKSFEALGELAPRTRAPLKKAMRASANVVARYARALLRSQGRTGRFYKLPGSKRTYQASAPGEPPAKLEADLAKSIKTKVSRKGFSARILSGDRKAHIQEYGSEKQAPRPFLRASLAANSKQIFKLLEDGFFAAIGTIFRRRR